MMSYKTVENQVLKISVRVERKILSQVELSKVTCSWIITAENKVTLFVSYNNNASGCLTPSDLSHCHNDIYSYVTLRLEIRASEKGLKESKSSTWRSAVHRAHS